jgi:hypothetical protein
MSLSSKLRRAAARKLRQWAERLGEKVDAETLQDIDTTTGPVFKGPPPHWLERVRKAGLQLPLPQSGVQVQSPSRALQSDRISEPEAPPKDSGVPSPEALSRGRETKAEELEKRLATRNVGQIWEQSQQIGNTKSRKTPSTEFKAPEQTPVAEHSLPWLSTERALHTDHDTSLANRPVRPPRPPTKGRWIKFFRRPSSPDFNWPEDIRSRHPVPLDEEPKSPPSPTVRHSRSEELFLPELQSQEARLSSDADFGRSSATVKRFKTEDSLSVQTTRDPAAPGSLPTGTLWQQHLETTASESTKWPTSSRAVEADSEVEYLTSIPSPSSADPLGSKDSVEEMGRWPELPEERRSTRGDEIRAWRQWERRRRLDREQRGIPEWSEPPF